MSAPRGGVAWWQSPDLLPEVLSYLQPEGTAAFAACSSQCATGVVVVLQSHCARLAIMLHGIRARRLLITHCSSEASKASRKVAAEHGEVPAQLQLEQNISAYTVEMCKMLGHYMTLEAEFMSLPSWAARGLLRSIVIAISDRDARAHPASDPPPGGPAEDPDGRPAPHAKRRRVLLPPPPVPDLLTARYRGELLLCPVDVESACSLIDGLAAIFARQPRFRSVEEEDLLISHLFKVSQQLVRRPMATVCPALRALLRFYKSLIRHYQVHEQPACPEDAFGPRQRSVAVRLLVVAQAICGAADYTIPPPEAEVYGNAASQNNAVVTVRALQSLFERWPAVASLSWLLSIFKFAQRSTSLIGLCVVVMRCVNLVLKIKVDHWGISNEDMRVVLQRLCGLYAEPAAFHSCVRIMTAEFLAQACAPDFARVEREVHSLNLPGQDVVLEQLELLRPPEPPRRTWWGQVQAGCAGWWTWLRAAPEDEGDPGDSNGRLPDGWRCVRDPDNGVLLFKNMVGRYTTREDPRSELGSS
eukprot:TRINITY_DN17900_c0_g1_i1.p1 TRINITY_DN17900_c0_g1~~TRINITY_DN17900_c0_g1_i1.p1  ORF type:complete len:564 (+),score=120.72 TRINITY_DN17900_c0_g1_i1:106-1692(+)